ncbi:hypothetical protein [Pseudomonas japonica]|uniref:hypothetical protein n=1 Tax=Pseudomonas japonica TaxID=256466 RepID=UPI0015E3187E|nr:hypothetical protein [Pseudomonas japonica]MBA1243842.1 hypothetical protein [Pseudomonas japonica]
MSTTLPPNDFFVLHNLLCEMSFATFTNPDWVETEPVDETNSCTVLMNREADGLVFMRIDDCGFRFTTQQAMALARKLMELSGHHGN